MILQDPDSKETILIKIGQQCAQLAVSISELDVEKTSAKELRQVLIELKKTEKKIRTISIDPKDIGKKRDKTSQPSPPTKPSGQTSHGGGGGSNCSACAFTVDFCPSCGAGI